MCASGAGGKIREKQAAADLLEFLLSSDSNRPVFRSAPQRSNECNTYKKVPPAEDTLLKNN